METFLISGCGVSAICNSKEGVQYWISQIIERGGVPTVTRWMQS